MNPSSGELERLRIEEVRYLHSLWRAGPPPNRTTTGKPKLHTLDAPPLTKENKRMKMEEKEKNKDKKEGGENPPTSSGADWPTWEEAISATMEEREKNKDKKKCGENPPTSSGADWSTCEEAISATMEDREKNKDQKECEGNPPTSSAAGCRAWAEAISATPAQLKPSAEEVERFAAFRLHRSAAKACEELLAVKDEETGGGDEDDTEMVGEEEAFLFFLGFFSKEEEVRRYYEGNAEKGNFFCFVCWGVGEKLSRTYCSCVSLVQHANTVTKTKAPGAHRAYGKAICRVMGWDFGRLPSIVLDMQGPLCPPAPPASSSQVNLAEDVGTDRQEHLSSVLAAS